MHPIYVLAHCAVYDVGRRETYENLRDIWLREVEMYCTGNSVVKMLVANKIDVVCP